MLPEEIEFKDENGNKIGKIDYLGDFHKMEEKIVVNPDTGDISKVTIEY